MQTLAEIHEKLEKKLINDLKRQQRTPDAIDLVRRSFVFAADKHSEQKRKSGEPYIVHPVAVARTLMNLGCDTATVCAGLLHDVVEDTEVTTEDIQAEFGDIISALVDGVTKLSKLNFKSSEDAQANNFRKMLLAIADDMRVVLVKLADRLNNMQTLQHLREEKRKRIAQETLDIFAPLANRFGLRSIKTELEDLALKYLYEEEHQTIKDLISSKREEREAQLRIIQGQVKEILESNHLKAEIQGRAKHFFSIFKKLKKSGVDIPAIDPAEPDELQLYDLIGIRLIVRSLKECYAALGLIHETFPPVPGRFKDYIAMPKSNMYQSLHTTVMTPWGKALEVQIRTQEMHEIAEFGIAAHWNYKESGGSNIANEQDLDQLTWVRQLISWHTDVQDAQEYMNTVKEDMFSQEVYIFTPKGDVYALPVDSTPVDFAYKIHSKVGDTCAGAKVNEKIVSINYQLQNGDLVEIITSKNAHPNLSWLNFVKTNQAKHRIKSWYKKQNRERHLTMGHQMLEEEFGKDGLEQFIKSEEFVKISKKLNQKTTEDLIAALGSGDNTIGQIKGRLVSKANKVSKKEMTEKAIERINARKAPAKGDDAEIPELDGLLYNIAKCCNPIPGEDVYGVVSKGKGISIHRKGCHNLKQVEVDRIMQLNWKEKASKNYSASLALEVVDRVGIVKDILTLLADAEINIRDFKVSERKSSTAVVISITLTVSGQEHLHTLMTQIKNLTDVLNVYRT